jgi:hypothetical protein
VANLGFLSFRQNLNYELEITNYELRIKNYELRIRNYELRIKNYDLEFGISISGFPFDCCGQMSYGGNNREF